MKKGYNVPRAGTIQLTLFNPLKTVVKMFVVPYDLTDMPPGSCTFLRQRTLYTPTTAKRAQDLVPDDYNDWSRKDFHKYSRWDVFLFQVIGRQTKKLNMLFGIE